MLLGNVSHDKNFVLSANLLRSAETVEVIRVQINRGNGTESMPTRLVDCYFLKDGSFIGENDPVKRAISE